MRVLGEYGWEEGDPDSPSGESGGLQVVETDPFAGLKHIEADAGDSTEANHRALWVLEGTANNRNYFVRIYFKKSGNPSSPVSLCQFGNMAEGRYGELVLQEDGTIKLIRNGSVEVGKSEALDNEWHYLELRIKLGTETTNGQIEARLDGESFAVNNATNLGAGLAPDELRVGVCDSEGGTGGVTLRWDCVAMNDDQGEEDISWVGALNAEDPPVVVTGEADEIGGAIATLHGTVNPKGLPTDYWFEYGPTEAYGSKTAVVEAGDGEEAVDVEADLTGLDPETPYHLRLVAENEIGETQGEDAEFETGPGPSEDPVETTFVASHEGADPLEEYGSSGIFEKEGVPGGSLTAYVPGYGGGKALLATVTEPDGFARGIATKAQTGWKNGQKVRIGCGLYVPKGFFAAKQGQIDVGFRAENYEQDETFTERIGLAFHGEGKEIRLVRIKEGEPDEQVTLILGPELEEERWYWIEILLVLWHEDELALNELWIDDAKVGESNLRNCARPDFEVSRLRTGLPATNGKQTNDISVVVDRVMAGPPPLVGPLEELTAGLYLRVDNEWVAL